MPFTEFHVTIYTFTGSFSGWWIIELDLDFLVTFSNLAFTKLKIGEWQSDCAVMDHDCLWMDSSFGKFICSIKLHNSSNDAKKQPSCALDLGINKFNVLRKDFWLQICSNFLRFRLLFKTNVLEFGMPSVRERIEDGWNSFHISCHKVILFSVIAWGLICLI